jgi:deazaflavin-dependent oxidoreductase (nitroreductase family)
MGRVPPFDPDAPRSRLYRASEAFAQTRPGRWLAIHVAPHLDLMLMKTTGGRVGSFPGARVAVLTAPGRKSGVPRATPLLYFTEGEDVILIASSYGRERHPAWYRNALAAEVVDFRVGPRGGDYRVVEVVDPDERRRLYDRACGVFSGYAGYEARAGTAGRTIPVLRLTPAACRPSPRS